MGPSTLCKTLEELVNKVPRGGLHVRMVASKLSAGKLIDQFSSSSSSSSHRVGVKGNWFSRVTVGRWLGPSTLCKTWEELVNNVTPGGLHVQMVASKWSAGKLID